jgi:hypothetical protein
MHHLLQHMTSAIKRKYSFFYLLFTYAIDSVNPTRVIYSLRFVSTTLFVEVEVCLRVESILELVTRYYFLSERCCLKVAVFFLWGALSDERTDLQFAVQSLNGPIRTERVTILYCLIWDFLDLECQVPVFISPRNRVAQLYPWALGSLYVASLWLAGL